MPLCRFTDDYLMFDVTPVDNMFIEDYMMRADGDFVKVYLYGLRLCYRRDADCSLERMASVLGVDEQTVMSAYAWWERQGLVRRVSDAPPAYEYVNLRRTLLQQGSPKREENDMYPMRGFNSAVDVLLKGRVLHGADYARMYNWMEDYSLSESAVLMVVRFCADDFRAKKKKTPPTLNSIEKLIIDIAKKGLISDGDVEAYLAGLTGEYAAARRLLERLGIRRAPTQVEVEQVAGWLGYGFEADTLLSLCDDTINARTPTLGYLDKIVESYRRHGAVTLTEIERIKEASAAMREVLRELDPSLTPNDSTLRAYRSWRGKGFEQALLLGVAHDCRQRGKAKPAYYQAVLDGLEKERIFSVAAYEDAKRKREQERAARPASGQERQGGAAQKPPSKEVAAQRYDQREYSEQDNERFLFDLDKFAAEDDDGQAKHD